MPSNLVVVTGSIIALAILARAVVLAVRNRAEYKRQIQLEALGHYNHKLTDSPEPDSDRYEPKSYKPPEISLATSTAIEAKPPSSSVEVRIACPKCRSTQITADRKGYGAGKAVGGLVLLGPVGLLGGFLGSRKILITCLKCGHQWKPK